MAKKGASAHTSSAPQNTALARFDKVVRSLRPIYQLPPDVLNNVVTSGTLLKFDSGESIAHELEASEDTRYLVEGELRFKYLNGQSKNFAALSPRALEPLGNLLQDCEGVFTVGPCHLVSFPTEMIERLMAEYAPETSSGDIEVNEVSDLEATASNWMLRLLQKPIFSMLPPTGIQNILESGKIVTVKSNEVVIRQDEAGDYFYIIKGGQFVVSRKVSTTNRDITLATLRAGDFFGEEALISGAPRNATVTASEPGDLLKLRADELEKWFSGPLIQTVSPSDLESLANDVCWIDTRNPDDYAAGSVPGSKNIVVDLIRTNAKKLSTSNTYIVCHTKPELAAVASFHLKASGIDARCLDVPIEAYCSQIGIAIPNPPAADAERPDAGAVDTDDNAPAGSSNAAISATNQTISSQDPDVGGDSTRIPGTMDIVERLADERSEYSGREPAPEADYAETSIGIGLADLISEMTGADEHPQALDDDSNAEEEMESDAVPPDGTPEGLDADQLEDSSSDNMIEFPDDIAARPGTDMTAETDLDVAPSDQVGELHNSVDGLDSDSPAADHVLELALEIQEEEENEGRSDLPDSTPAISEEAQGSEVEEPPVSSMSSAKMNRDGEDGDAAGADATTSNGKPDPLEGIALSATGDLLAIRLERFSDGLESEIRDQVALILEQEKAPLQAEFKERVAVIERDARESMRAHELKVANDYKVKEKHMLEKENLMAANAKKLIELANKISQQKSELQKAKKVLQEQLARPVG